MVQTNMDNRVLSRAGVPKTAEKGSVPNEYVFVNMDKHLENKKKC